MNRLLLQASQLKQRTRYAGQLWQMTTLHQRAADSAKGMTLSAASSLTCDLLTPDILCISSAFDEQLSFMIFIP
jgi:hypothetical protein